MVEEDRLRVVEIDYNGDLSFIPYSVVSYVWYGHLGRRDMGSPETTHFDIRVDSRGSGERISGEHINIDVLRHIAKISLENGLAFTWIDRLCIMQNETGDKAWQIERMPELYERCGMCLVLPDGLCTLASPDQHTPWMRRMWTMQEGLLPERSVVVFSWSGGSGILINTHKDMPNCNGSVVGYIEQSPNGVGTVALTSLLQIHDSVAFVDERGDRHGDIRFRLLDPDCTEPFSSAMARFKMMARAQANAPGSSGRQQGSQELLDVHLWLSVFKRDGEDMNEIVSIISRTLRLPCLSEAYNDGVVGGQMSDEQKLALSKALDISSRDHSFRWHSAGRICRFIYDIFYAFDIGSHFYPLHEASSQDRIGYTPHLAPPVHTTRWTSEVPEISPSRLFNIFEHTFESLTSLAINGDGCVPNQTNSMSIAGLGGMITHLPQLDQLRLLNVVIGGPDRANNDLLPQRPLKTLYLDVVAESFAYPSMSGYQALLTLFDLEELYIVGPPPPSPSSNHPIRDPGSTTTAATPTAATFLNFEYPICGIHALHIDTSYSDLITWFTAFTTVADRRMEGSQPENVLHSLDVVCEDMQAAYLLGDFLRSPAAISVEHLELDLSQLCRTRPPGRSFHNTCYAVY